MEADFVGIVAVRKQVLFLEQKSRTMGGRRG